MRKEEERRGQDEGEDGRKNGGRKVDEEEGVKRSRGCGIITS